MSDSLWNVFSKIASEAVYEDYYKLKKRYEAENREKSDALTRVDQVNFRF